MGLLVRTTTQDQSLNNGSNSSFKTTQVEAGFG
jgi:hypothetical protein